MVGSVRAGYERSESELSESTMTSLFLSPRLPFPSFSLSPSHPTKLPVVDENLNDSARSLVPRHRFSVSPSSLSGEFSRKLSERCPEVWSFPMNIGRSINFKTRERRSPSFRLQARRNIVVNFRDLDPGDVIITELNPNVGAARLPPTYEV